jgi:hypothetical protein
MKKESTNDEIDLLKLFLNAINILRANFWLILCFFLLGTALGFLHYYSSRKIYENRLIISSSILTRSYGKILIDNLNKHRRLNDIKTIADQLNVSQDIAKDIAFINIENFIEADELKESDRYVITVEVYNEEILPELQQGLIYYLENNEFAKVRVEQNKSYMQQMISKIDHEIKDMEEFKIRIFKGDLFQGNGNVMFDPTAVNSKIIELTEKKLTLQNNFSLANSVHVVEGFTRFTKPSKPKLSLSLISGSTLGLIFVAIVIAFKSIRKLLRMADAAKQSSS